MLQSLLAFMMFKESHQEISYVNFSKEDVTGQPTMLKTDRATYFFYKKKMESDAKKLNGYKNSVESIYTNFFMKAFNKNVKGKVFDVKGDEMEIRLRPFSHIYLNSPLNISGRWSESRFHEDGFFESYICHSPCKLKNTKWNVNVFYEDADVCRVDLDDICTFTVNIGLKEFYTDLVGVDGKTETSYEVVVKKRDNHQKEEIVESIIKNEKKEDMEEDEDILDLDDQLLNIKLD